MKKILALLLLLGAPIASAQWTFPGISSSGGGTTSPLTTKGDIWTYSTLNARFAACANGQVLGYDSAQSTGLVCVTVASAPFSDATAIVKNAADATKQFQLNLAGITTGNTVTAAPPIATGSYTQARQDAAQTFTGIQTSSGGWRGQSGSTKTQPMFADPLGTTGWYEYLPGSWFFSSAGTPRALIGASRISGDKDVGIGWAGCSGFACSEDTMFWRIGAHHVALGTATALDNTGIFDIATLTLNTANGAVKTQSAPISELLALSTSGTSTNTAGNLGVADSDIESITARITTTITTATNWSVFVTSGIASCTSAWVAGGTTTSAQTTLTAGTVVKFFPAAGLRCHTGSASTLTVTTTGTPGAGAVRLTPFVASYTAPTS